MTGRRALVVGGTGPTGPAIVNRLLAAGYETTIYHSGAHEVDFDSDVEHLHGDNRDGDDIAALGGDAAAVEAGEAGAACRIMVAYTYYAVERISPYAMLGSVHVLEGLSVLLADRVADTLKARFGTSEEKGFSYLRSHGALDQDHVAFFQTVINGFTDRDVQDLIIGQSKMFYRLYGAIFEDLGQEANIARAA